MLKRTVFFTLWYVIIVTKDRWILQYKAHQKDEMENLRKSGSDEEYEERETLLTEIHSALTSASAAKHGELNSQNDGQNKSDTEYAAENKNKKKEKEDLEEGKCL